MTGRALIEYVEYTEVTSMTQLNLGGPWESNKHKLTGVEFAVISQSTTGNYLLITVDAPYLVYCMKSTGNLVKTNKVIGQKSCHFIINLLEFYDIVLEAKMNSQGMYFNFHLFPNCKKRA